MFVDDVGIEIAAGDGGNGCLSFRRERSVPRGGPDGGDGGHGGSVYLRASVHLNTLINFKYHPVYRAERGAHGEGSNRTGRAGRDLYLDVPAGTVVYRKPGSAPFDPHDAPAKLVDLAAVGQVWQAATGGRGGRGNQRFATATNRAPRRVQLGQRGEACTLRLQLKLLADIGLVGYPNVGKSTLIARLSAARPKIANYPFTTLTPQLGVVRMDDERSFVLADVPGLVEGAHAGHGLGHRFLSHLERTKALVHVIDISSVTGRDPVEDFETIRAELSKFKVGQGGPETDEDDTPQLTGKPELVAANKIDALDEPERLQRLQAHLDALAIPFYAVSAASGEGLSALREAMWSTLCDGTPSPTDANAFGEPTESA